MALAELLCMPYMFLLYSVLIALLNRIFWIFLCTSFNTASSAAPLDSVSEDVGIVPRAVATLAVRRSGLLNL